MALAGNVVGLWSPRVDFLLQSLRRQLHCIRRFAPDWRKVDLEMPPVIGELCVEFLIAMGQPLARSIVALVQRVVLQSVQTAVVRRLHDSVQRWVGANDEFLLSVQWLILYGLIHQVHTRLYGLGAAELQLFHRNLHYDLRFSRCF